MTTSLKQIARIRRETAKEFHYSIAAINGASKKDPVLVIARQTAMALARKLTAASLPEIARAFNRKNHRSVTYAMDRHAERAGGSPIFAARIERLDRTIRKGLKCQTKTK